MISDEEEMKKSVLEKIKTLNKFIREMEDYAKIYSISLEDDKLYIVLRSHKKILRDLLGGR